MSGPVGPDAGAVLDAVADGLRSRVRAQRLAAAGLVSRPLDSDQVALAPLGEAILGLLGALEDRLTADSPDGGRRSP